MRVPTELEALREVELRLAELVGEPASQIKLLGAGFFGDASITVGAYTFVVEWKSSGTSAPVASAVEQLRHSSFADAKGAIPLIAVPFMGPGGRSRCKLAEVAWLDLSGNARIVAPGIHVVIEGLPNRFKRPGRPGTAFAPKSARIARWLLSHPDEPITQRELARATGMDEGFTSRIVAKLERSLLVVREANGAIRPRDPQLLLDAWHEEYEFSKHHILRGHIAARSGEALLHQLSDALQDRGARYAATGLAAAWLLTKFANFRLVTMYLNERPSMSLLNDLGFRGDARGANVWLVVPNDSGVFQGAVLQDGVRCVHPIQVYLDLKEHPERAKEAAERLRVDYLKGHTDDA